MKSTNTPKMCSVCFEDFGKTRKRIVCPGCPEEKPSSVCRECTEEYLLENTQEAHCLQCKNAWGYQFMYDTFPNTFITKTYRQNRQEKALEREKGLLPQTMPLVALEKEKKLARERVLVLRGKIEKIQLEYQAKIKVFEDQIREEMELIRSGSVNGEKVKKPTQYLFPCTKTVKKDGKKEKCKGYIEKESWSCGLCETKVCKKCHVPKIEGKKHECKKDDVETAKMIIADTKPCPKCKARIFKINGCDQMFCTSCSTPFSWESGQIVKGVIHNPHYYEMIRTTGLAPRNAGDVPCGGIPPMDFIFIHITGCQDDVREQMNNIHRRSAEIESNLIRQRAKLANDPGLEPVRLRWLLGEYKDEKTWQKAIFVIERNANKKREEIAILDTFVTASAERFNNFIQACQEIDASKQRPGSKIVQKIDLTDIFIKDIEKVRQFCNKALVTNFKAMGYKSWAQIDFGRNFQGHRYKIAIK